MDEADDPYVDFVKDSLEERWGRTREEADRLVEDYLQLRTSEGAHPRPPAFRDLLSKGSFGAAAAVEYFVVLGGPDIPAGEQDPERLRRLSRIAFHRWLKPHRRAENDRLVALLLQAEEDDWGSIDDMRQAEAEQAEADRAFREWQRQSRPGRAAEA